MVPVEAYISMVTGSSSEEDSETDDQSYIPPEVIFRATALIRSWSLLPPLEAREHLVTGSIRWEMVARDIFNRFGWR